MLDVPPASRPSDPMRRPVGSLLGLDCRGDGASDAKEAPTLTVQPSTGGNGLPCIRFPLGLSQLAHGRRAVDASEWRRPTSGSRLPRRGEARGLSDGISMGDLGWSDVGAAGGGAGDGRL